MTIKAPCFFILVIASFMFVACTFQQKKAPSKLASVFYLNQGKHQLEFHPKTGLLKYVEAQLAPELLSDSVFHQDQFELIAQNDTFLHLAYPATELSCQLTFFSNLEVQIKFDSKKSQKIHWPKHNISKAKSYLIWPKNEGYYIPFSDSLFARYFSRGHFNTSTLSLPFWAVEQEAHTTMFQLENPFHNQIRFQDHVETMELTLEHEFTPNAALATPHELVITHLSNHSPITPALHFREKLMANGQIKSLRKKIEEVPLTEQAIAAPWIHLDDPLFISKHDLLEGKRLDFIKTFCQDGQSKTKDTFWSKLDQEAQGLLLEMAASKRLNNYQKKEFVRILSSLLNEEGLNSEFSPKRRANAQKLYEAYPSYLLPVTQWGDGISIRMIDALKNAGIDRAIIQVSGHLAAAEKKEVVDYAKAQDYLFGTYDSYHSIHDPSAFGTDSSWPTAQMTPDLFATARMKTQEGDYYGGFKQIGGLASPMAVRHYYEQRISNNFEQVPYSYYFVDCDAFGEYYDDYTEGRTSSQQQDCAERIDRLQWLRETYRVPIGSEKGIYLFTNFLDINEGVTVPIFGFGDKDMKDKNSKYYKGGYWPPEMMEIKFKEVPLKEKYIHLFLDPRFKIPLWESVYHDCVISTAHPGTPSLKFTNARTDMALTELFYQYPPVYNLNLAYFDEHQKRILHHYSFFRQTHPQTAHQPLTQFDFLSEDRLIQRIAYKEMEFIANYSLAPVQHQGNTIPAKSILFIDGAGTKHIFTPEAF